MSLASLAVHREFAGFSPKRVAASSSTSRTATAAVGMGGNPIPASEHTPAEHTVESPEPCRVGHKSLERDQNLNEARSLLARLKRLS